MMSRADVLADCLVTLVLSITANLLTPGMRPLWATMVSWQRRGLASQTRQNLKMVQSHLDQ
jgi:hypothetical protein